MKALVTAAIAVLLAHAKAGTDNHTVNATASFHQAASLKAPQKAKVILKDT